MHVIFIVQTSFYLFCNILRAAVLPASATLWGPLVTMEDQQL
jgi:hypothetical protein